MSKQAVYQSLADKMIGYADLVGVPVRPCNEKLTTIMPSANMVIRPIDKDMYAYTGNSIYVRSSVASKLKQASRLLASDNPELQLEVVYGYRALSIQRNLFLKYKKQLETQYTGEELLEAVHRLIAVPEIAGHPTGGAVDLQIIRSSEPIEMGTKIWQFDNDSFTFSPFISKEAQANRQLLRQVMMKVGFAPFDGEWWHFSFGDKEWAKYYGTQAAIYGQTEFSSKGVNT